MSKIYDLIIIGGGPAGYVAGIRARQLGLETLVIEREHLGGTCLNVGCIPTKTLFQSAEIAVIVRKSNEYGISSTYNGIDFKTVMDRKNAVVKQLVNGVAYLLKKNKAEVVIGEAKILSNRQVKDLISGKVYDTKNILIATGSSNSVPPLNGIDGKNVIDSTELLNLTSQPKSMAIIGGGVIGCEFASILNSLGSKISVIEMMPKLLGSMDSSLADAVEKDFVKAGINVELDAKVLRVENSVHGQKKVIFEKHGKESSIEAEYVLVSTGRKGNSNGLGLETLGVEMTKGFIKTDAHMKTNVPGVYAAGDITGQGMLAHTAFEGGTVAVENIAGNNKRELDLKAVPKVVFVDNEVASVGMTESEAKEAGYDVITGVFSLSGNGKSLAMGKNEGFVKIVSEKRDHMILGMHMQGPTASELVTVGTQLIASEMMLEDVEYCIYPHPAVSESIREACLAALGRAIHA